MTTKDRVITIHHRPGCGGVAYFAVSRDVGGSFQDMGHITVGAPPDEGEPIPCHGCSAPMVRETVNGEPKYVMYRPYVDAVRE